MSDDQIRAGLTEILHEIAGVLPETVTDQADFSDDLDVDSLSMVEVIVAAEERFGVRIPDDDAKSLRTVGDAVVFIRKAGVPA